MAKKFVNKEMEVVAVGRIFCFALKRSFSTSPYFGRFVRRRESTFVNKEMEVVAVGRIVYFALKKF